MDRLKQAAPTVSSLTYQSGSEALGNAHVGPDNGARMRSLDRRLAWLVALLLWACTDSPPRSPAANGPGPASKVGDRIEDEPAEVDVERSESPEPLIGNVELQERCDADAVTSCVELGDRFREGWDVEGPIEAQKRKAIAPKLEAALAAYERACSRGVADGCAQLGFMYERGLHVAVSVERAVDLYQRACDAGGARGCSRLGALHLQGPKRDLARAHAFSESGCKGKDPLGCVNLALMHRNGDGVAKDDKRASELLHTACLLQEGRACTLLAELYGSGEGVDRSPQLALMFNRRGCALGDARGCGNLGVSHQLGFGVERDEKRAAHYFHRACEGGEQRYCELLRRFEQQQASAAEKAP
jgi:TPR repeat protein